MTCELPDNTEAGTYTNTLNICKMTVNSFTFQHVFRSEATLDINKNISIIILLDIHW